MHTDSRRFYMVLSIVVALATMGVKFIGYFLTGSVGLFSDAAEIGGQPGGSTCRFVGLNVGCTSSRL